MFSYDTDDRRNRALIRVHTSPYSGPQSFEAIGQSYEVVIPKEYDNQPGEAHLGVSISNGVGQYKMTKIITIRPRWVVESYLDDAIYFRQPGLKEFSVLEPGAKKDIIYLNNEFARLQFRFGDNTRNKWFVHVVTRLTSGPIRSILAILEKSTSSSTKSKAHPTWSRSRLSSVRRHFVFRLLRSRNRGSGHIRSEISRIRPSISTRRYKQVLFY